MSIGNWLTPLEAANRAGVKRTTIYSAIDRGHLITERLGGRIYIHKRNLIRWQNDPLAHQEGRPKGKPSA